jgi:hypothetical protein
VGAIPVASPLEEVFAENFLYFDLQVELPKGYDQKI